MAGEPWNRVNIAFPGAVSRVRVHYSSTTDASVKALLGENEKVLRLIQSTILQTEVRVLYELLYFLNNSFRGHKTIRGLKQVEQCLNRMKSMKLSVTLQELAELCPSKIQRAVSLKAGECDVPSQPMLEWLSLKVLGAAQLMSCMLNRCSRAFSHSKQHLNLGEFTVLNMVITSMLSRLWVIARGILVSLSTLYQQLLELLREVANAQPMPFLTDFSLPADMAQFLGPPNASLLTKKPAHGPASKDHKEKQQQRKNSSVKVQNQRAMRKVKEDLGVAVERGAGVDTDLKPFLKVYRDFTKAKSFPQKTLTADKNHKFKKQVREATTFTDMAARLEERILWCKSHKMEKEKHLLTFLHLKCRRMKCLEAAGYNVQRKLRAFRQEVRWASSSQASLPRSPSSAALRRCARRRRRFQLLRRHCKSSTVRTGEKKKQLKRQRRRTAVSVSGPSGVDHINTTTSQTTGRDDIDDIFASVGL